MSTRIIRLRKRNESGSDARKVTQNQRQQTDRGMDVGDRKSTFVIERRSRNPW